MAVILSDGTTTLTLPDDVRWTDEHSWSPVQQSVSTSLTGALIIDTAEKLAGRPVTLQSEEGYAWITYAVVGQLKTWATIPEKVISLNYHGTLFDVMFRHHESPAIDVTPVVDYAVPDSQDFFYGSIKLMEV